MNFIVPHLFIIFVVYGERLIKLPTNSYMDPARCITRIVRSNFPCGIFISLINTQIDHDKLQQNLNKQNNCYTFIQRTFEYTGWLVPTDVYIIKTEDVNEYITGMTELSADTLWNPRANVIVAIKNINDENVTTVFKTLLKYNVYKAVILQLKNDMHQVLSFRTFKQNYCGTKFDVAKLGNCKYNSKNFFQKVPSSLRNCTLRMAVSQIMPYFILAPNKVVINDEELYGIDQFLIETIAEKQGLRTKIVFILPKKQGLGMVYKNHTTTNLLKYIRNNRADVAGGGMQLVNNRAQMFDYIWGFHFASYNLYLPVMGEDIWKDIYKEYSPVTWFLIVFAYSLVMVICLLTQIIIFKKTSYQELAWIPLSLVGYLFLNTGHRLSKYTKHRTILVFWIWFAFFICHFYSTALYSLITTRQQSLLIVSEDNLHQLPYEPCISFTTRQFLKLAFNQTLPRDWNNPKCIHSEDALDYVASSRNAYTLEKEYVYMLKKHTFLDDLGRPTLESFVFTPNNPMVFFLPRGYPLLHQFQYDALKIYETGLMENHISKIYSNNTIETEVKTHYTKLLLQDLNIHFVLLLLGLLVAIICFGIEVFWDKQLKWCFVKRYRFVH